MVIRLMSVSDRIDLPYFIDIFCAVLWWSGQVGYIPSGPSSSCIGRRSFLYVCDTLHRWEWDVQVLDIEDGMEKDTPVCFGGCGATPPEFCGGPTGYRLRLKRQREGRAKL
jgi:Plasmid pRiA4b ORF-3-like protein